MQHEKSTRRRAPGVMLHRLTGDLENLVSRGIARYEEPDVIELLVPAAEASEGGMITIRMRVPIPCVCAAFAVRCAKCGETGTIAELFSAWLALPPDAEDGTLLRPSALLPGMRPISFRVRRAG